MSFVKIENMKEWIKKIDFNLHAQLMLLQEISTETEAYLQITDKINRLKITKEEINKEIEKQERPPKFEVHGKS